MTPLSTLRARLLLSLGLSALVLAPAAAGMAHAAGRLPRPAGAAGSCGLPLVHDHYVGFHIGVPAGWELSTLQGLIVVSKDPAGTELALVYPALLTKGRTPARFFAAVSTALQHSVAAAGNALSVRLTSTPGQLPQALLTGRAGTVAERGRAEVLVVPAQTALATEQVVYAAYWAPAAHSVQDSGLLARIGRCYGPEAGTLYQKYHDQVFTLALPLGWQVDTEGQDLIALSGDANRAAVSYELVMVPARVGATTPRALLTYVLGVAHIQIDHILASADTPTPQTQNGGVQGQEEVVEFTGQFNGTAVHGVADVSCYANAVSTTGPVRLALATADQWNAVNSGLLHVLTSIQHSFAQDQAEIARINQQQQQFAQNVQQFDNVLTGVQDVQDPATGTVYEAPYDSYDQTGPEGPGYYLDQAGTLVRLQPVTHQ